MANPTETITILLPEGRVINHSLFVMDQYDEKAKPAYKIELAYEPGVLDDFYNQCLDAAVAKWGKGADEDKTLIIPILEGNQLATKREEKGKSGDAYKGLEVIRANTIYNKNGENAPGGVQVFAADVSEIGAANQEEVYQGCYGQAAVTIGTYVNEGRGGDADRNALTFYLSAFQKTKEGERLVSTKDLSSLFSSRGGRAEAPAGEAASGGRRARKG